MYNLVMIKKIPRKFLGLSFIFPLIYLYLFLFPPTLISPEDAISFLAVNLNNAAEKQKLKGYITSIENIEGRQDKTIAKLKDDLNAVLFAYKKWNVLVGENDRAAVKNKINLYMSRWKGMLSAETFYRLAKKEAGTIRRIKYYPIAVWQYVPEDKHLCRMTIDIVTYDTKRKVLSVSSKFTHPVYYARMKLMKKVVNFGAYISAGILVFTFSFWALFSILLSIKRKKTANQMPVILERLENYSKQGHFVAAERLAVQCMAILPDNTDLIAFKERLEDFCGGSTKKAQIAYVEMLKLKKRIPKGEAALIPLLGGKDKEQIEELLPYSSDLKIVYQEYSALTKTARAEKQKNIQSCFDDAQAKLSDKEVATAEELLRRALELDPEFSPARTLLDKIEKTKAVDIVTLIPDKTGKEVIITSKDVLTFGRDNADVIIAHNKISRQHLKIMIIENKVIAEDADSTNGTYHMGQKINKSQVSDGDIIDLARAYRLIFHICTTEKQAASQQTLISAERAAPVSDESGECGGIYIESDSKDILIVKKSIPVDLKVIGMVFDPSGQYKIEFKEGLFFLTNRLKSEPVLLNEKMEAKGLTYHVM